jgi:ParB family chromosome partitioning protein
MRRQLDDEHVKALMMSMTDVGLIEPVVIDKDNGLIAGYHRFKAAHELGWERIDCIVIDLDETSGRIATIDENLVRRILTVAERSELLAERKKLYLVLHPETKAHVSGGKARQGKKKAASVESTLAAFSTDTATKTGRGRRAIEREVSIGERLAPDVMEKVKQTDVADNKGELEALAELTSEEQRAIIRPEIQVAEDEKRLKDEIKALKATKKKRAKKRKGRIRKSSPKVVAACSHPIVVCQVCGKRLTREGWL